MLGENEQKAIAKTEKKFRKLDETHYSQDEQASGGFGQCKHDQHEQNHHPTQQQDHYQPPARIIQANAVRKKSIIDTVENNNRITALRQNQLSVPACTGWAKKVRPQTHVHNSVKC